MSYLNIVEEAKVLTRQLMSNIDERGHGYQHCEDVLNNADRALTSFPELSEIQKLAIRLAALLHDVDDRKIFNTTNYANARGILHQVIPIGIYVDMMNLVIELISLVSCSSNGNSIVEEKWKLIPRDSDRVEAIGNIGILRAYLYTVHIHRPLICDSTPLVTSEDDIWKIATPERFEEYLKHKCSVSMIDHFYDKMLHICTMQSGAEYLIKLAETRKQEMIDFLIKYCADRTTPIPLFNEWNI